MHKMSYKEVRSFESLVSWLAKNRNYQASKLQKMSSRMPCTHEPWVLWPAKNCTMCFITPQKSHFQDNKMQKMNSYKGKFPWTVGFTSRKNRIFRSQKWRKSTQTKRSTLEQWVTRLGKNRIFMTLECKIELTRKYVPLNRLFKESAEIAFSGRQSAENPWTVGITIRQKSHIKVAKKQQRAHTKLGTLETWVSRLGKNSGLKNEENLLTLNEGLFVCFTTR